MPAIGIALNILLSIAVFGGIVGGLTWAVLTSRGDHHQVKATRRRMVGPRPEPSSRPSTPASRDRGQAVAV